MSLIFEKKDLDLSFFPAWDDIEFSVYKLQINESEVITAFFCIVNSEESLDRIWLETADYINHEYLSRNITDFERWNSYLLFVCGEKVSKSLQYEIENDKFAIRKIVVKKNTNWIESSTEQSRISILNEKVLLSHITLPLKSDSKKNEIKLPSLSVFGLSVIDEKIPSEPRKVDSKKARDKWIEVALSKSLDEI
ncbi:hypothetical protein CJF25_16340 [Photobacterium phosphoreum]|uniref:ABC-three component system middle component 1 n=1 Tax=Photobacterium phosphoreum TaxID=659 RepID=UPI001E3697F3|nr:ABC-three component system middle component 1 [Photobacterium phosphoreum]MCD9464534.1 hypothetical protein [Photobacterium phosphoreum]